MNRVFLFFFLLFLPTVTIGKINLVTTTPDLAWAARIIGGELVSVNSLLGGTEDPHHVDIVPTFVHQVSRADIVCQVGLSLEVGWMSRVISRSGNGRVQPGSPGHCVLGDYIEPLEIPQNRVDRSMGDVHSDGNPHFTMGPTFLHSGSRAIVDALIALRPDSREVFEKNYQELGATLSELRSRLKKQLDPVRGRVRLMEYHKELTYFAYDYGLSVLGTLEEVPGIPPSAGRLAERSRFAREQNAQLLISSLATPERVLKRFEGLSGVPFVRFPTMMTAAGDDSDYLKWQTRLVNLIVEKAVINDPKPE